MDAVMLEGLVLEVLFVGVGCTGWAPEASTGLMVPEAGCRIWDTVPRRSLVTFDTGEIQRTAGTEDPGSRLCVVRLPEAGGAVRIVQDAPITPVSIEPTRG